MTLLHRFFTWAVVMLSLAIGNTAWGDGGVVRLSEVAGPFRVTVFASPAILEPGPADLSVLVQTADSSEVVLDADVVFELRPPPGVALSGPDPNCGPGIGPEAYRPIAGNTIWTVRANRSRATNKLLQAAWVEFPVPGHWTLAVTITRGAESATLSGELRVEPGRNHSGAVGLCLAMPPVAILLFGAHARLRLRCYQSLRKYLHTT